MTVLVQLTLLVLLSVCVRLAARVRPEAAPVEPVEPAEPSAAARAWQGVRARRRRSDALPALPLGHRPPAGLGPLSPSERFLSSESARGIRALQVWLIDQTA
jgi:hypothetical protein